MHLNSYATLSQATKDLGRRGFKAQFDFRDGKCLDLASGKAFAARELAIVEYHRFEGMSDPGDTSIVFAIEADDKTKGTLIMNYGAKTDLNVFDFMDKVRIRSRGRS